MLLLIGIRYELRINLLWHIRIPLARDLRVADYAKEQNRYSRGQTPSWNRAAFRKPRGTAMVRVSLAHWNWFAERQYEHRTTDGVCRIGFSICCRDCLPDQPAVEGTEFAGALFGRAGRRLRRRSWSARLASFAPHLRLTTSAQGGLRSVL
jgi:hypothetical protein